MREDIFDEYLASILNKSSDKPEDTPAGAETPSEGSPVATETPSEDKVLEQLLTETVSEEETITDFAEKTIRLSGATKSYTTPLITEAASEPAPQPVRKQRKKRIRRANYSAYGGIVLATLVLCCSILISLFVIVVGRDFLGIDTNNNEFTLYIQENWGISTISDYLYENGVIEYPQLFTQYAKLVVGDGSVYPGDINVKPSMSYADIIESLTEMRAAHSTVRVTFVEGCTIDDAARILEENGVCSAEDFIFAFNTNVYGLDFESHVGSSGMKFYKYEGYLFPDTYEFYVEDENYTGDSVYNIVKKIKEHTAEILNEDVIKQCRDMGYTLEEVVTMASLLQLESGVHDEMKKVASVFYNRLNNPSLYPRLQSDTTYRYINNVIKAGTSIDFQDMYDAYDTYVCNGLPVGPICNPGADAIDAALHPDDTPYFYFCSNLETREFFYAETYAEQLENQKLAGLET